MKAKICEFGALQSIHKRVKLNTAKRCKNQENQLHGFPEGLAYVSLQKETEQY